MELVHEVGYERCTIEAIAHRAKASKATIYRRWRNKQELLVSALQQHSINSTKEIDSGSLREDLIDLISEKVRVLRSPDGALISELLSAAKVDSELGKLIPNTIREQQDTSIVLVLDRAQRRGEISSHANVDLLLEIIPAIFAYRIFTTRQNVNKRFIEQLVDDVIIPSIQKQPTNKERK
jgi:AcrR family transcriptional regulator